MKLSAEVRECIDNADHKALATCCNGELNVVPVSVVRVVEDTIWLHNFFMDKTVTNVCKEPHAALALWNGFVGVQIKGRVTYEENGEQFTLAKEWIAEHFPQRILRGLLVFTPDAIYDISANAESAGKKLL